MSVLHRREWISALLAGGAVAASRTPLGAQEPSESRAGRGDLVITQVKITPIALPDPPILAAGGCHGPYFLRNIIELRTAEGIVGIGETHGGAKRTAALNRAAKVVTGKSALAYRKFAKPLKQMGNRVYAGIELACLDAVGKATGRRLCELLGGPVRQRVEFAAYLFFRYAADNRKILDDARIVDNRGRGDRALDAWGEVRTPEAMAEMAWQFHKKWGFQAQKLKAGVLPPTVELKALQAINERFGGKAPLRIDPNGRWTVDTALRVGRQLRNLPLEYYEDPVAGQAAMATVRKRLGLPMSTNSCVTDFDHIPDAVRNEPIDVVLGDHHIWGGIPAFQTLGTMCDSLGWRLSQHSNNHAGITMAAMIHVGAVVPQLTLASDTHYVWLVEGADIIEGDNLPIRAGHMKLPTEKGLGVAPDQDKLARAHEVYRKCGMRERNDAATMRRLVPNWKRTRF